MTRQRLLLLTLDHDGVGGIEKVSRALESACHAQFEVTVVSAYGGRSWRWTGTRVAGGRRGRRLGLGARAQMIALAASERLRGPARHVLAVHISLLPLAAAVARLHGASVLAVAHGQEAWALRANSRDLLNCADGVWAVSDFTRRKLLDQGVTTRIDRLHLPVDEAFFELTPSAVPGRVLTVSRLQAADAYKGVRQLIAAWQHIKAAVPRATLDVVGTGDDLSHLKSLSLQSGAGDSIRFRGRVDKSLLLQEFAEASVFALPGRTTALEGEGFGIVFVEAAAAGVPTVAPAGAGAEEACWDGRTGLLVGDDGPESVTRSVVTLLRNEPLRLRMGRTGRRELAPRHSVSVFEQDVLGHLERLPAAAD